MSRSASAPAVEKSSDRLPFPRSVAFLLASRLAGGEERYLAELGRELSRRGVEVSFLNLKQEMPYRARLEEHDIDVSTGIADHRLDLFGSVGLFRELRSLDPDVLVVNSNRQALLLASVYRPLLSAEAVVLHTHDHLGEIARTLRFAGSRLDVVLAASRWHREQLIGEQGLPAESVRAILPGLELARLRNGASRAENESAPSSSRGPVIGIVANLRPEKDHRTFLRAAAALVDDVPDLECWIAGDGPLRGELETVASELGIEQQTRFLGWTRIDAAFLSQLDALVLSSRSETFPAVILEGFAAGVPVVATEVGAVAEMLGDPPAGRTVPPGDPSALADALREVIRDPTVADRLRRRGMRRVEHFSVDRFCDDFQELAVRIADVRAGAR